MVMLRGSMEAHIRAELETLLPTLELEPVKEQSDAPVTFAFSTTAGPNRLVRTGTLVLHFYGVDEEAALNKASEQEKGIEKALSGTASERYTIAGATFDTQLPVTDEETGEFINVECTYNIQYTIRR